MERRSSPAPIVLIIEDEAEVAQLLALALNQDGFRTLGPATTLSDALALLDTEPVDAALLSYLVDGERAGPVVTELERRHIPFAIVTAHADRARKKFPDAAIIAKPFQPGYIAKVLRELIGPGEAKNA